MSACLKAPIRVWHLWQHWYLQPVLVSHVALMGFVRRWKPSEDLAGEFRAHNFSRSGLSCKQWRFLAEKLVFCLCGSGRTPTDGPEAVNQRRPCQFIQTSPALASLLRRAPYLLMKKRNVGPSCVWRLAEWSVDSFWSFGVFGFSLTPDANAGWSGTSSAFTSFWLRLKTGVSLTFNYIS